MKNLKGHKINIPSNVIEKCWDIYSKRYRKIELTLKNPSIKNSHLHTTGSFQITLKQADSLLNDEIFQYFLKNEGGLIIKLKSKYLFRGKDYFPGFSKENFSGKLRVIFFRLKEMLTLASDLTSPPNIILYLSLLDYIKNYLFICLYAVNLLSREYKDHNQVISKHDYRNFVNLIQLVENIFVSSQFGKISLIFPELKHFIGLMDKFEDFINKHEQLILENQKLSQNLFRKIRECNNPERIAVFSKMVSNTYLPANSMMMSFEYGGIELPFIVNALRNYKGKNMIKCLTVNLSSYSTESSRFAQSLDDITNPFNLSLFSDNLKAVLILDDSVTTGRTLERLVKMLPENVGLINFAAVSFTNTNRFHHLTRKKHGGINPLVVENSLFIYRSNFVSTYTKSSYTNKNGVFDKEKYKIIKLLKSTI